MKIALGVQYDGSQFAGWQRQTDRRTVQACIESALSAVANHPVAVTCAGRTDAGVHALNQVIHFEPDNPRTIRSWLLGANSNLPSDVSVNWVTEVDDAFHARFSATARTYEYVIFNAEARPGLWSGKVTWECRPLDAEAMHGAAQCWLGEHDFSAFRAAGCQSNSPNRNIRDIAVRRFGRHLFVRVTANAFLQHMVRNLVGVLLEIGRGDRPRGWAQEVLASCDRRCAGATARPDGLYLVDVSYPEEFVLPDATAELIVMDERSDAANR